MEALRLRAGLLQAFAILVLTLLAYLPAMRGEFLWDDDQHFSENPLMTRPGGLATLWTSEAFYYPLTSTTFWIERRLWDLQPTPYHQVNIVLHAVNAMLLWVLLRRLGVRGAWLAGAAFALHPVNVQSVAWITELKNVQSGFFFLLALYAWVRHEQQPAAGRGWYFAALGLGALAILSKSSTVILPGVLILIHAWLGKPWERRTAARLAPFFALSALAAGWTIYEQQFHSGALGPEWTLSWGQRLILSGRCVWFYLGKLFWPTQLTFVYPRWTADAGRATQYLPALGAATLLGGLLVLYRRGRRAPALTMLYYLAAIFPVLAFFRIYYHRYTYVSDHWQYLGAMGVLAWAAGAGAWLAARLAGRLVGRLGTERVARGVALGAAALALATLGGLTWRQSHIYQSRETLWRDTLAKNPGALIAYNNLALHRMAKGDVNGALALLNQGLARAPQDTDLLTNLGGLLVGQGQFEQGVRMLRQANQQAPTDPETLNNLGLGLDGLGQRDEAARMFRQALKLKPAMAEAANNLAKVLLDMGQRDEAVRVLEQAQSVLPENATIRENLAILSAPGR